MKTSTMGMIRKHGLRIDRAAHNYLYFKFYAPYTKTALVLTRFLTTYFSWVKPITPFGKAVFNRYHAKVLTKEDTRKILTLNKDIRAVSENNKKIVPYKYATKIIFQDPEHIAVMDCPCKLATGAPSETVNSCFAIGKDISTFWLEHCKKYHPRKISQEEALELMEKLRATGHITQAFFKVATGGSTGVVCNCHPDTCVSLIASRLSKKISPELEMNADSGYAVEIDMEKCVLSGDCTAVCPVSALSVGGGRLNYNKDVCLGCGLCVEKCAYQALTLYRDTDKTVPLDVNMIDEKGMILELAN